MPARDPLLEIRARLTRVERRAGIAYTLTLFVLAAVFIRLLVIVLVSVNAR